jgi:hypothetical protein
MGCLKEHRPVKLIASLISGDKTLLEKATRGLEKLYGDIERRTLSMDFDYTDYYEKEFGPGLKRKVVVFKQLAGAEKISDIKLRTNELENELGKKGRRTVNIDPGYMTDAKLVLLTTKDYSHRIYTGKGIFAEVTLRYEHGSFRAWPWTYPDYASKEMTDYFNDIRELYLSDLKRVSPGQA